MWSSVNFPAVPLNELGVAVGEKELHAEGPALRGGWMALQQPLRRAHRVDPVGGRGVPLALITARDGQGSDRARRQGLPLGLL